MEAEDIIQQKEWRELDGTERQIVSALADTEAEYNLIKKMLLVSQEELDEVPVLGAGIRGKVNREVEVKVEKRPMVWYYAAAAVLVIALMTFILLQKEAKAPDVVVTPVPAPVEQPLPIEQPAPVVKDTTSPVQNNMVVTPKPAQKDMVAQDKQHTDPVMHDVPSNIPEPNAYVQSMTRVGDDPELLGLVTEVY